MEAAHAMRPIDRLIKVISNTYSKMELHFSSGLNGLWGSTRYARPGTAAWDFNLCKCLFSILYISVGSMMMYAFYFRRRQTDDSPNACSFRKQKPVFRLTRAYAFCNLEWVMKSLAAIRLVSASEWAPASKASEYGFFQHWIQLGNR